MVENQIQQIEGNEIVPVEVSAIEGMERAAIDIQIATAHKYPRSLTLFYQRAETIIRGDRATAEKCIYRRPVGKGEDGKQKIAEGESIRLAEIVAASYGNLRVAGMITEITPRHVKAVGFAHDLESNYAARAEAAESTVTRDGRPYSENMRLVVAKAAQSKAMRDAIFRVVPKAMCKRLVEVAASVALDGKTMKDIQEGVVKWATELGVPIVRVFAALGVNGMEDLGIEEVKVLAGLRTAITDGDCTVEEAFPRLQAKGEPGEEKNVTDRIKDHFADKPAPQKPPPAEPTKRGRPKGAKNKPEEVPPAPAEPQDGQEGGPNPDPEAMETPPPAKYRCTRCKRDVPQPTKQGRCPFCLAKVEEI